MECTKLNGCLFVKKCEELGKGNAAIGFVTMYCKGDLKDECVRLQLCNKFSKELVPKNMMPNGYPLSGTSTDDWGDEAKNYSKYL